MDKTTVLKHLQNYIHSKQKGDMDKKTSRFLSTLATITDADISFGKPPQYFFAYMKCNSTGVGRSSFQGTETQRTVAQDYVTDEYLFVDGHIGAGDKGLQIFYLKPGQTIHYYKKSDIIKLAKECGFQIHLQYFHDLNFSLYDHRLNRHTVHITKGPFTYPIYPIYATTDKVSDAFTIGYVYEADSREVVIIDPQDPKSKGAKEKSGCAPWMYLSFICPPVALIAVFVLIAQVAKERMRG